MDNSSKLSVGLALLQANETCRTIPFTWIFEMKFVIDGKLQFDEYFDTQKMATQSRRSILRTIMVFGGIFLIVPNLPDTSTASGYPSWQLIFGIALLVYGLIVSPLQFRYRVRRNWNRYPAAHMRQRFFFDNTGMTIIDDVGNPAITKWNKFVKWRETESTFMLFLSPLLWVIIPKRLLGIEKVLEFRVFVSSMLNKRDMSNQSDQRDGP